MKLRQRADLFILFFQIIFLAAIGFLVNNFKLELWANLILNIFVISEILLVLRLTMKLECDSKSVVIISFLMLGAFYIYFIVFSIVQKSRISNLFCAVYENSMGYLAFNGFLSIYKRKKHKAFLIIGAVLLCLTFVVSMLSVFGLATPQIH